jgi:hypothetical protein
MACRGAGDTAGGQRGQDPARASPGRDTPRARAPRCLGASVASSGMASGRGVRPGPDVEAVGTPVNTRLTALFSKNLNRSALQCK